jgi:farnesol dehydrogenase
MSKHILVTGSTGFIGQELVNKLAKDGNIVHALCRSEQKAKFFNNPNIKICLGDIENTSSLDSALENCTEIYHLAAFARVWHKDPDYYYKVNVDGTETLIKAAIKAGVKRMVFTSTAGVLGASGEGYIDENSPKKDNYTTYYEDSKYKAEQLVKSWSGDKIEIVIVNPSRLFGPGLLNESNSVSKLMTDYSKGKWHFMPGDGNSVGNYAFIDDVVNGHILAMQKGKPGERYIMGGENLSFKELFQRTGDVHGKQYWLSPFPLGIMLVSSKLMELGGNLFGITPKITPPWIRKYSYNYRLSMDKSVNELGYHITPFEEAAKITLDYFNS